MLYEEETGVAKDGSLPPFVMVAVKYSAIQEMLDRMLSDNAGFFLMNEEGEILQSSGEKNKYKDMETFGDVKRDSGKCGTHRNFIKKRNSSYKYAS